MAACSSLHILHCVISMAGCVTVSALICHATWELIHRAQVHMHMLVCEYNAVPGELCEEMCVSAKPILRTESLLTSTLLSVCYVKYA